MEKISPEQMQLRREALQLLEDNQMYQLLQTRLQVLLTNKRREQREAAFSNDTPKAFGCEWAIWGLEQTKTIVTQMRDELKDRTEKPMNY